MDNNILMEEEGHGSITGIRIMGAWGLPVGN
jgi:hypothetical protein